MKKNILTIIIMAISLINTILLGVFMFTNMQTFTKTNKLIDKIVSIVDLELESPASTSEKISVENIETKDLADKLTILLKKGSDGEQHYAVLYLSLSMDMKNKDYKNLKDKIDSNAKLIEEIVNEEFSKYTIDNANDNVDAIKGASLTRIKELFNSDFIINISFGSIIYQ